MSAAAAMRPNPFARAWLDAATDLGIRVVHPFTFTTRGGHTVTTEGVFLPDFGGPRGTVLLCRFDPDELDELLTDTEYYTSALNPTSYEPYRRDVYLETLNDWGWYGPAERAPSWYTGQPWS